jgi:hypothetical protein
MAAAQPGHFQPPAVPASLTSDASGYRPGSTGRSFAPASETPASGAPGSYGNTYLR